MAAHGFQHDRRVAHVFRHRPGLIQRRGKGHDTPARAAPVGGLDAGDAGKGGGLADRTAGIGAGGRKTQIGRHRGGGAARRAARRQRRVFIAPAPRVDHVAIDRGFVGRAHGEFIHVQLAQHHRTRIEQVPGDGGFILGHEPFEDAACRLAWHALGAEQILDAQRQAAHVRRVALGDAGIRRPGLFQRQFGRVVHKGVQRAGAFDGVQAGLGEVHRGHVAAAQFVTGFGQPQLVQIAHHSTTFGTAKKPSRASGALARILSC